MAREFVEIERLNPINAFTAKIPDQLDGTRHEQEGYRVSTSFALAEGAIALAGLAMSTIDIMGNVPIHSVADAFFRGLLYGGAGIVTITAGLGALVARSTYKNLQKDLTSYKARVNQSLNKRTGIV